MCGIPGGGKNSGQKQLQSGSQSTAQIPHRSKCLEYRYTQQGLLPLSILPRVAVRDAFVSLIEERKTKKDPTS